MNNNMRGTLLPDTLKKSNFLIKAKYSANLFENKLLAVGLATVKVSENNRLEARISKSQLQKFIGGSRSNFYDRVKSVKKLMYNNVIFAEDPKTRRFKASVLITDVEWGEDDEAELIITFNDTFRAEILDIKDNYTILSLNGLSKIDTIGAYRLYETLLAAYNYKKSQKGVISDQNGKIPVQYSIAELRCMMNCVDISHPEFSDFFEHEQNPDYDKIVEFAEELSKKGFDEEGRPVFKSKYSVFRDFNKRCLTPAVEEINSKTNLTVEYNTITGGKGGKVIGIEFYITDRNYNVIDIVEATKVDLDELQDEVRDLIKEKISTKEVKQIMAVAGNDFEKIKKAYEVVSDMQYNNFVACMIAAIKEDWNFRIKSEKSNDNKNSFSDFETRDYDLEDLDKLVNI